MDHIYILILSSTAVISSLFTVIFIRRNAIWAKWIQFKSKHNNKREERLKSLVKQIVYEYLDELKNGKIDD